MNRKGEWNQRAVLVPRVVVTRELEGTSGVAEVEVEVEMEAEVEVEVEAGSRREGGEQQVEPSWSFSN